MLNYAGRDDVDDELRAELLAAAIEVHDAGKWFRDTCKSEVKTSLYGILHGWQFTRAWRYWIAKGPGLPPQYATPLHVSMGEEVRVAGHCGCPSPLEWYRGFGVDSYHVDTQQGLSALAQALKMCAEDGIRARNAEKEAESNAYKRLHQIIVAKADAATEAGNPEIALALMDTFRAMERIGDYRTNADA